MSLTHSTANDADITATFYLFAYDGAVLEVRIPGFMGKNNNTGSGYFNNSADFVKAVKWANGQASGVYATLNPVRVDLIARAKNRISSYSRNTTSDDDVIRRRWLLIDLDPLRPAGISSSDAEHEAAISLAFELSEFLLTIHATASVVADSGNGAHVLIPIDLPIDAEARELCRDVLDALAYAFDTTVVQVDKSTFNASRISKIYGTLAKKGDSTNERPHRLAKLLKIPEDLQPASMEVLRALAALKPPDIPMEPSGANKSTTMQPFKLDDFIRRNAIHVARQDSWKGGTKYVLAECPFNTTHVRDNGAYIVQFANGAIAAGCHHDRCQGKGWRELREMYEPKAPLPTTAVPAIQHHSPDASEVTHPDIGRLDDLGLAARFAVQNQANLRYCHPWKRWMAWDGKRWLKDDTSIIYEAGKNVIRNLSHEALATEDQDHRAQLMKSAAKYATRAKIMDFTALAQHDLTVSPNNFDTDPMLLNCVNGVLDLRTGQLRSHDPNDLVTKLAPVNFEPGAAAPLWEAFLYEIFAGDADLIDWIQRLVGYSLTGETNEQAIFVAWGEGANGKSSLLRVLSALIGDYAITTPAGTLMARRSSDATNDLAALQGARLIAASESEATHHLAEATVKRLTGQDRIAARFLYGEFFEFEMTGKIWLATNHKPGIKGADAAIWRRVKMIPFSVTIPLERQKPRLADEIINEELSGVLNWALAGCLEWQKLGLGTCAAVSGATAEYKAESDSLQGFILECCKTGPGFKCTHAHMFKAYKTWCLDQGLEPFGRAEFSRAMGRAGFSKSTGHGNYVFWQGVMLQPISDAEAIGYQK